MSGRGEIVWRGVALLGCATGVAALALALMLWSRAEPKAPAPTAATPAAVALAGRTAMLSRLLAERRAVARIQLAFGDNGALAAACRAESADGAESPCFGAEKGIGTWSLRGARLCLSAAVINLAAESCYDVSGEAPTLQLAGSGFLAGNITLR
jgi:hypothetical protein